MATTMINIPVEIPQNYSIESLTKHLTDYAQRLILLSVKINSEKQPVKHYKHKSLCGIIAQESHDDEFLEGYLSDKYAI